MYSQLMMHGQKNSKLKPKRMLYAQTKLHGRLPTKRQWTYVRSPYVPV